MVIVEADVKRRLDLLHAVRASTTQNHHFLKRFRSFLLSVSTDGPEQHHRHEHQQAEDGSLNQPAHEPAGQAWGGYWVLAQDLRFRQSFRTQVRWRAFNLRGPEFQRD